MMYISNVNSEMQGSSGDTTMTFDWIQDEHLSGNTATLNSMYVCMWDMDTQSCGLFFTSICVFLPPNYCGRSIC